MTQPCSVLNAAGFKNCIWRSWLPRVSLNSDFPVFCFDFFRTRHIDCKNETFYSPYEGRFGSPYGTSCISFSSSFYDESSRAFETPRKFFSGHGHRGSSRRDRGRAGRLRFTDSRVGGPPSPGEKYRSLTDFKGPAATADDRNTLYHPLYSLCYVSGQTPPGSDSQNLGRSGSRFRQRDLVPKPPSALPPSRVSLFP